MLSAFQEVQHLLEVGGSVLVAIFCAAVALWTLLIERFFYALWVHPERAEEVGRKWDAMPDKDSWDAQVIRRLWISELTLDLDSGLAVIRSLVSVCPLLGLLGTTTGMVEVFESMAMMGNSEPRLMAAGVSQAMVTTMAGLVVALSGIFFSARLEHHLMSERDWLDHRLHIDEDLIIRSHRVRNPLAKERTRNANVRRRRRKEVEDAFGVADRNVSTSDKAPALPLPGSGLLRSAAQVFLNRR